MVEINVENIFILHYESFQYCNNNIASYFYYIFTALDNGDHNIMVLLVKSTNYRVIMLHIGTNKTLNQYLQNVDMRGKVKHYIYIFLN